MGAASLVLAQTTTVSCSSKEGERQNCPADTSAGVVLQMSVGTAACLLGKTWGYDNTSVWVSDGCSGEFILGQSPQTASPATVPAQNEPAQTERIEEWGSVEPGKGFLDSTFGYYTGGQRGTTLTTALSIFF